MKETNYLIITKRNVYIIEGLYGPQFRYHKSFFWRLLCFILGIILFNLHSYSKKDFVIKQMFPNIPDDWESKSIIVYNHYTKKI